MEEDYLLTSFCTSGSCGCVAHFNALIFNELFIKLLNNVMKVQVCDAIKDSLIIYRPLQNNLSFNI